MKQDTEKYLKNTKIKILHLGLNKYESIYKIQEKLHKHIVDIKSSNNKVSPEDHVATPNYLLFCEHHNIYTIGKTGTIKHLLLDTPSLKAQKITLLHVNRGGDITYHGAGQLILYLILDLENFFTDIHLYIRLLEKSIIDTLNYFEIKAITIKNLTGVWVNHNNNFYKICAIGIRLSKWVTMHGLALNVNTDMKYFDYIIPCGIKDKKVTSISKILKKQIDPELVTKILTHYIKLHFNMEK